MLLILVIAVVVGLLVFLLLGASVFAIGATLMLFGAILGVIGLVLILLPSRALKESYVKTKNIGIVLLIACPILLIIGDTITGTVVR